MKTKAKERAAWAVFNDIKDVMLTTGDESQDECPYTIYDVQRLIADVDEAEGLVEALKGEHSNWTAWWHLKERHAGTVPDCDNHWCKKRCAAQKAAAAFLEEPA